MYYIIRVQLFGDRPSGILETQKKKPGFLETEVKFLVIWRHKKKKKSEFGDPRSIFRNIWNFGDQP
jgi:hypothetical protein